MIGAYKSNPTAVGVTVAAPRITHRLNLATHDSKLGVISFMVDPYFQITRNHQSALRAWFFRDTGGKSTQVF